MRPVHTSSTKRSRRRFTVALVAGAVVLAACGGGSDSTADGSSDAVADVSADGETADSTAAVDEQPAEANPAATGDGLVDLVGPDVVATAEIETNLLPSVVLDDVTSGRKVNFRNLVPQEKPILLWMYAPH
ncbi:hypothetical protein [Ilumatobacter sp.]|uniref:hypothetical protein n=1 Tax=Ilumatobacter sp. TaxID=1967498 RepID=UPI003C31C579